MGIKLTPKEYLILKRLGKENADIACELGNRLATIETHIRTLLVKMNAENRTQAVIKAIQLGILDPYQFII